MTSLIKTTLKVFNVVKKMLEHTIIMYSVHKTQIMYILKKSSIKTQELAEHGQFIQTSTFIL